MNASKTWLGFTPILKERRLPDLINKLTIVLPYFCNYFAVFDEFKMAFGIDDCQKIPFVLRGLLYSPELYLPEFKREICSFRVRSSCKISCKRRVFRLSTDSWALTTTDLICSTSLANRATSLG